MSVTLLRRQMNRRKSANRVGIKAVSGFSMGVADGRGGEFVPIVMANEFIEFVREQTYARQLFRVVKARGKQYKIPKVLSGLRVYHTPAGAAATQVRLDTSEVILTPKKMMAQTRIDSELDEDSVQNMSDLVRTSFANGYAESEEMAVMAGDPTHAATKADPDLATDADWFVRDARTMYNGLSKLAADALAPAAISLAGVDFTAQAGLEKIVLMKIGLGKFGYNTRELVLFVGNLPYNEIQFNPSLLSLEKYGAKMTQATGEVGKLFGNITVVNSFWHTQTELIMTHRRNVIIADWRLLKFVTTYDEDTDQLKITPSGRVDMQVEHVQAVIKGTGYVQNI